MLQERVIVRSAARKRMCAVLQERECVVKYDMTCSLLKFQETFDSFP